MENQFLAPAAQVIGIFLSLLYFSRQAAEDRHAIDGRMAKLDDRMSKLDERWLKTEEKILKIMNRLEMN